MSDDNVINMHMTNAFNRNRTQNDRAQNNKEVVSKEKLKKVVPLKKTEANIIPIPGVEIKIWVKGHVYIQKMLEQANLNPIQRSKVMNRIAFYSPTVVAWNGSYCDGLPVDIVAKINTFIIIELKQIALNLED